MSKALSSVNKKIMAELFPCFVKPLTPIYIQTTPQEVHHARYSAPTILWIPILKENSFHFLDNAKIGTLLIEENCTIQRHWLGITCLNWVGITETLKLSVLTVWTQTFCVPVWEWTVLCWSGCSILQPLIRLSGSRLRCHSEPKETVKTNKKDICATVWTQTFAN